MAIALSLDFILLHNVTIGLVYATNTIVQMCKDISFHVDQ